MLDQEGEEETEGEGRGEGGEDSSCPAGGPGLPVGPAQLCVPWVSRGRTWRYSEGGKKTGPCKGLTAGDRVAVTLAADGQGGQSVSLGQECWGRGHFRTGRGKERQRHLACRSHQPQLGVRRPGRGAPAGPLAPSWPTCPLPGELCCGPTTAPVLLSFPNPMVALPDLTFPLVC